MKIKTLSLFFIFFLMSFYVSAEDLKVNDNNIKMNVYSGIFDFSHDSQRSTVIGVQHQNVDLKRNTFLGKLSPITGAMITADNAAYFYTGVQAQYKIGSLNLTPSFTPGFYESGDGKNMGSSLEFKTEVQLSVDMSKNSQLGLSYNHLSNGGLGDKNPGANSYMFNFFKKF